MRKILIVTLSVLLGACGTVGYIPEEYAISPERIQNFDIKGDVSVENIQADQNKVKFFDGSMDWVGDYKTVTDHLVTQLQKEIKNHGKIINTSSKKTIQVKVVQLNAIQHAFHFTSSMRVQVKLGNGMETEVNVGQGSPGNMWRVLNGTIALGVIDILKDPKVRDYLSQ